MNGPDGKHWTSRRGRWHPGRPFSKQSVLGILKNVTYIGQVNYKGTIYPGEQPPLLEQKLFEQVQEQLQRQRLPEPKPGGSSAALLKGLLWCEACQARMVLSQTSLHGRRYRYYVCGNAQRRGSKACLGKPIPANVIEESVLAQVIRHGKLGNWRPFLRRLPHPRHARRNGPEGRARKFPV